MAVRRSTHVFISWAPSSQGGDAVAFSPLTGEWTPLSGAALAELLAIPVDSFVPYEGDRVDEFCRRGLLVSDGTDRRSTDLRAREEELAELGWEPLAAGFHFANRFQGAVSGQVTTEGRSSPTVAEPARSLSSIELPLDEPGSEFQQLLLARRTHRDFGPSDELSLDQLSTILRYVWGAHRRSRDVRNVPILGKTSPSGGSLNPIGVYPLLAAVAGVEPGLYHYAVGTHSLELMERIDASAVRRLADLFVTGQDRLASAQAFFPITVRFERAYSKYPRDAGVYQSLLVEAGHFSQTFYLVCTELGLGPFVTCSINHADIDQRLGLDPYAEGVVAVCGCGLVSDDPEWQPFEPRSTRLD